MERAISASDARLHFLAMLLEVQKGETYVVTSRGLPVAKVMPVDEFERQGPAIDALLASVKALPRRRACAWRREDLYERPASCSRRTNSPKSA